MDVDPALDRRILNLRIAGGGITGLADQFGLTDQEVLDACKRALDAMEAREPIAQVRDLELARIDLCLRAVIPLALQGNLTAARTAREFMQDRRDIYGLDNLRPKPESEHDRLDALNERRRTRRTRGMPHAKK